MSVLPHRKCKAWIDSGPARGWTADGGRAGVLLRAVGIRGAGDLARDRRGVACVGRTRGARRRRHALPGRARRRQPQAVLSIADSRAARGSVANRRTRSLLARDRARVAARAGGYAAAIALGAVAADAFTRRRARAAVRLEVRARVALAGVADEAVGVSRARGLACARSAKIRGAGDRALPAAPRAVAGPDGRRRRPAAGGGAAAGAGGHRAAGPAAIAGAIEP